MNRLVRIRAVYRIQYTACGLLAASVLVVSMSSFAKPPTELRLFHEPVPITENDVPDTDSLSSESSALHRQQKQQNDATASTGTKVTTYRYNGFIATDKGRHFLVNGQPLHSIDTLVLVSVKHDGQSLVLRTHNGPTFELSIGEFTSQDAL